MRQTVMMAAVMSMLLMNLGCDGQSTGAGAAGAGAGVVERQYFGSRRAGQPASVTETQQEGQDQDQDQAQVRARIQQQQNFLAFVQQQGLLRQQVQPIAPAYPFNDATPRSGAEYQLAQLQYQQQILEQQQKLLLLQLQQQRQQQQSDRPSLFSPQVAEQQQQQQQRSPLSPTQLGVAFSPATSVAHTRFSGNGINYHYR